MLLPLALVAIQIAFTAALPRERENSLASETGELLRRHSSKPLQVTAVFLPREGRLKVYARRCATPRIAPVSRLAYPDVDFFLVGLFFVKGGVYRETGRRFRWHGPPTTPAFRPTFQEPSRGERRKTWRFSWRFPLLLAACEPPRADVRIAWACAPYERHEPWQPLYRLCSAPGCACARPQPWRIERR